MPPSALSQFLLSALLFSMVCSALDNSCKMGPGRGFDNPCCAFPCQNGGVCMARGKTYICDCTGLEYFGNNCHRAKWTRWFRNLLKPSLETQHSVLTTLPVLWAIVNNIGFLHRKAMRYVYTSHSPMVQSPSLYSSAHDYITMDSYFNRSYYAQDLPPIPPSCPTAMGVKGPIDLPSTQDVFNQILLRKEFKPCPLGTNLLFVAYSQHFVHQFFKTDHKRGIGFTWGDDGVDASQIYGKDEWTRRALRCFRGGKLKVRLVNDEDYPPHLDDISGLTMLYPVGDTFDEMWNSTDKHGRNVEPKWALGHPSFSSSPWLFVVATLWIREHNRVCEILQKDNPIWDDEQLYQTARLIVTGELIHVTIQDYMQHLSQYKVRLSYEPELLHETNMQYSNRIRQEFNMMYQWHPMVPDQMLLGAKTYDLDQYFFSDNKIITDNGLDEVVAAMTNTIAGEMTYQNHPQSTEFPGKLMLEWSRAAHLQSFNNYRKAFGMRPYASFFDLTGNSETAKILEELYKDIDAVEFSVGMIVEKKDRSIAGPSMVIMGGAWTIKGMMANALGSQAWWKPSTFGGDVGMEIIKKSSLQTLICNNLKYGCKGLNVSFTVPDHVLEDVLTQKHEKQLENAPGERKCGITRHSKIT